MDVHRDESARQPPCAESRFADLLQARVQGQAQVVAGLRGPVAERPAGATQRVDLYPLTAGGAAEELVVAVLDAGLADDVAGVQAPVLRLFQLSRADLADEPEEMSGERPVRVLADVGALDTHAGEVLLVLEQVEEEVPVEALLEHHRISGVLRGRPDSLADLALREPEQVAQLAQFAPARAAVAGEVGGSQLEGHHRAVVDQNLAVAIEDLAARWVNPDVEDPVVIGEGSVVRTVEDLQ